MDGTATLVTTMQTALTTVKEDVLEYIGIALPIGLAIMGTFLAVRLGIKFFRQIAK